MKDEIGQRSFRHNGGKAQHHPSMVAAHHGLVAGENDLLARKGRHHLPIECLADNIIGEALLPESTGRGDP